MPRSVSLLAALSLLAIPSVAAADVCVDIDTARDALPEADRAAAKMLLERQLIGHGRTVAADEASCTEHWSVAHIALGGELTVTIEGGGGSQTRTVVSIADLGAAYAKMVDALLAPPVSAPGFVDPEPLPETAPVAMPAAEAPQPRAPVQQRRGTVFARVGYGVRGATGDSEGLHGSTFGAGYRRSTETFGFEVSALNLMIHREDHDNEVVFDSYVRLAGFAYLGRANKRSTFAGVAFSYGESKVRHRDLAQDWVDTRTEYGPAVEAYLGTELLSTPAFHVDAGFNLLLPLYGVPVSWDSDEKVWSPGISTSVSVGF